MGETGEGGSKGGGKLSRSLRIAVGLIGITMVVATLSTALRAPTRGDMVAASASGAATPGPVAAPRVTYNREPGDIGLRCSFADGSGNWIFLYTERHDVRLKGDVKGGVWTPEEVFDKIAEDNLSVRFEGRNLFLEQIKPGAQKILMKIDRASLTGFYESMLTDSPGVSMHAEIRCALIDDAMYMSLVKDQVEKRAVRSANNKI